MVILSCPFDVAPEVRASLSLTIGRVGCQVADGCLSTVARDWDAGVVASRLLRAVAAVVLVGSSVVACVVVLAGQGLDRAEKWVSIAGVVVSVVVGVAGVVVGWQAWQHPVTQPGGPSDKATPLQVVEQNITATAPGATAQGAVFGNIINHPDPRAADPAGGEVPHQ